MNYGVAVVHGGEGGGGSPRARPALPPLCLFCLLLVRLNALAADRGPAVAKRGQSLGRLVSPRGPPAQHSDTLAHCQKDRAETLAERTPFFVGEKEKKQRKQKAHQKFFVLHNGS